MRGLFIALCVWGVCAQCAWASKHPPLNPAQIKQVEWVSALYAASVTVIKPPVWTATNMTKWGASPGATGASVSNVQICLYAAIRNTLQRELLGGNVVVKWAEEPGDLPGILYMPSELELAQWCSLPMRTDVSFEAPEDLELFAEWGGTTPRTVEFDRTDLLFCFFGGDSNEVCYGVAQDGSRWSA